MWAIPTSRCGYNFVMSRFPPWHFRSMDLGEVQVDPVHDEFFKAQDLADALVRESIQNSLDARWRSSTSTSSHRSTPPAAGVRARTTTTSRRP